MDRGRRQAFGKRWTPSARAPEMAEHQRSPSTAVMHHRRATCGGGPERRSASMPVQRRVTELPSERGSDHSRASKRQGEEPAEHRSNRGSEAPSAKVTKRVEPEIRIHENKLKGRAPGTQCRSSGGSDHSSDGAAKVRRGTGRALEHLSTREASTGEHQALEQPSAKERKAPSIDRAGGRRNW